MHIEKKGLGEIINKSDTMRPGFFSVSNGMNTKIISNTDNDDYTFAKPSLYAYS